MNDSKRKEIETRKLLGPRPRAQRIEPRETAEPGLPKLTQNKRGSGPRHLQ